MSKLVKFVAGAVLTVAGVITGNPYLIATGVSVGSSALKPKPKSPRNSDENLNRLRANIDVRTPRKTVIGITALATDIRDEEFTGSNQEYFHRFIVVASHAINQYDEIWLDDKLAWTPGGGITSDFSGYLTVAWRLEGAAGTAINISSRMGSSRRYTGLAYVHLRFKLTGNSKKAESPFAQSVPSRITIRGKGAKLYDPRLDSTEGGSGSHRADDQTTWSWTDDHCRNPALALLFYLLGWRINGNLVVGKGIAPEYIDLESFAVAANICDETVSLDGGGTEPRYRCDGIWSEGDATETVLDMLKATMNAELDDVDGKIRITIIEDETGTYDASFTDDDIVGDYDWQPYPPLNESFNIVRGLFTDPSDNSLYQPVEYPEVSATSPDGVDRIYTLNLPMVQSATQARRLAALKLDRQSFPGVFKADFLHTAWRVQKNSIVRLTFSPEGFVNKLFRVAEIDMRIDGVVPMVLIEEDADLYVEPNAATAIVPVAPSEFDPFKLPVVDALLGTQDKIRTARPHSARNTSDVARDLLTATSSGGVSTISVARHDWDYPEGTSDVTRELSTIGSLTPSTLYHVYFDDSTLSATTPTYAATTVLATAVNSSANPSRHYLGQIRTPANGGSATQLFLPPGYATGAVDLDDQRRMAAIMGARIGDWDNPLLTATDFGAGVGSEIHISEHTWIYPDGHEVTRALDNFTLSPLSYSTTYYVYFDDYDLDATAPNYNVSTTWAGAQCTPATPARHYVGNITTPANGGPDQLASNAPILIFDLTQRAVDQGLEADGFVKDNKVTFEAIVDGAINIAEYVQQGGTVAIGASETFGSGILGLDDLALRGDNVVVTAIVPYTITGEPNEGDEFYFDFEVYMEDSGGTKTYSDVQRITERWDGPDATGATTLERKAIPIKFPFPSIGADDWSVGYRVTTPASNGVTLQPYRLFDLDDKAAAQ